jgi:hypothetical protein
LLANVYLHFTFDLWVKQWRKRHARGDMVVVRFADDSVLGFQHKDDAERFLVDMRERLKRFSLSLHPDKTRLIEFGRFAASNRKRRGLGKPETFTFLGFTFICGTARAGHFFVQRRTRRDRMQATLRRVKEELRKPTPLNVATGSLAEAGRSGLLCLPCRPRQRASDGRVSLPCFQPLVERARTSKPAGQHDMGANATTLQPLAPDAAHSTSLASRAL